MGNFDRFEKLDMLGELNEKYIREAEKYLAEPLLADADVIQLAPVKRKLSWKPFAAAAACAAILIGGTALMSNYLNSRPVTPPVTNTSDSSDDSGDPSEIDNSYTETNKWAYLEEFRKNCRISDDISVNYARDKLNVIEFTLPDGSAFTDETAEKYRVIDETRLLSNYNDSELRVYKINSDEYETIYRTADDPSVESGSTVKLTLKYTTRNYALFDIMISKNDETMWELRLINLRTHAVETVGKYGADISDASQFAILANMVYFSDNFQVRSYKIHGNEPSQFAVVGWEPFIYNGRACYWHDDSPDGGRSPLSARYIDDDKPVTDINAIVVLIGKDHINYYQDRTLYDGSTGKPIITEINRYTYNNMAFDFGVLFEYETGCFCVYNAHTNEVLVMAENDPLLRAFPSQDLLRSEYDGLLYGFNGSTGYIIAEKPELWETGAEEKQQYLDNIRTAYGVSDDVEVVYMRDRLDVVQYSLPWDNVAHAADNGRLFIDSNRAITPSEYVLNKIEMYMLDTEEYVTLISTESDPLADEDTWYFVQYANKDCIVFTRRGNDRGLCVIDLNKEGYPCTTITRDWKVNSMISGNIVVDGNTIYFAQAVISPGSDTYHDAIYRYELGSTEPELYVEEGIPLCVCNGDLLYITLTDDAPSFADEIYAFYDYRLIHSKSGTLPIEGEKFGFDMWACKYGIFRNEDDKLIDCLTNKVILSDISGASIYLSHNQCDFGLVLGPSLGCIYDAHTNEVLVLEEGDDAHQAMQYVSCNWGFCGSYSNGYLICEK